MGHVILSAINEACLVGSMQAAEDYLVPDNELRHWCGGGRDARLCKCQGNSSFPLPADIRKEVAFVPRGKLSCD